MTEAQRNAYLIKIIDLLEKPFSLEEFKKLSLQLGISYDDLAGSSLGAKKQEFVTFLERRGRLDELRPIVEELRPNIVWPSLTEEAVSSPSGGSQAQTGVQLSQDDFDRLVSILARWPEFQRPQYRADFLDGIFAGSSRKDDILGLIDLAGPPRIAAQRLVTRLTQFGTDEPEQETLGVLINKLASYMGGGEDADFLKGLFQRYPLKGKPVSTRTLPEWRGQESPDDVQEKVIGENTLRDVRLLELALEASKAVVRITTENGLGSGFLVAPTLIMTNNHVLSNHEDAMSSAYQFFYQLDRQRQPTPVQTARTVPNGRFYTNAELDFTIVEVVEVPDDIAPLTLRPQKQRRDARVNIIQHPSGHYKKISMQNNFVAFADEQYLQYLTTTEPGSSGSPVFNNDFQVIGIHHSGGNLLEPGSDQRYLRNAGSSMIAVLKDLENNASDLYQQLTIG